uniref:ATP synthase CFO B chain subunit I n=1 Tax=Synarthrophyton chejuense TaxID=2485825 RepID=A0A3G3MFH6_9FLOR|nr:ATP synthase CFO B chain subunit I [Synarthrophyton chejuense]AYR05579.1 ATP synthase CFO B chain subunit I [Synarthrophyton chejuense]
MNNYMQVYEMICEHYASKGFGFNTDFLEANVINIFLLLSGLIYVLRQFLGAILSSRQQKVLIAIQEAEERLKQANIRLLESEKQFKQTEVVIKQIEKEAIITAEKVRKSILAQGKLDIERLTDAGKVSISIAEMQVREQIQQQITNLAIRQVALDLKKQITPSIQSKIIDENILQLGDKL